MDAVKKLFKPDGYFVMKFSKIQPETWVTIGIIVLFAIILIVYIKSRKDKMHMSTRMLVTGALCLATAFILSYIRVIDLPQGGSVTVLSLMPLIIFSYIYGAVPGLIVCFAYSLLQIMQGTYVVHWMQFLLDYPLAFTLIGLSGLFRKNIYLSTMTGYLLRYICHVLSGIVFFAQYAAEANFSSVVAYSTLYNSYAIIELIFALILISIPALRNMLKRLKSQYSSPQKV